MSRKRLEFSREAVMAALSYDPETGVLTRLATAERSLVGKPCGSLKDTGYLIVHVCGRPRLVHRLVWFMVHNEWPKGHIDHINGNRADNRISNLRDVTPKMNRENLRKAYRDSKTGVLGVRLRKSGRFVANLRIDGRYTYLGTFDTAEQAHAAYVAAKRLHHKGCTL